MIQYALKCENGHQFDSWFQSASAFDALAAAGHLSCAICGSAKVAKAIMAPRVAKSTPQDAPLPDSQAAPQAPPETPAQVVNAPSPEVAKAIAELRRKVEESSDYVGENFAKEARAMHLGEVPERSIYGEARLDQAKELIEDGVPLLPLPFRPKQKLS